MGNKQYKINKILHVLYSGLGGHGNVFFSLISADKKSEFTYEALFFGIEEVKQEYLEKCKEKNIKYYFVKKKKGLDIKFYGALARKMTESNADILFLHGSTTIVSAKIAKFRSKKKIRIIVRETQYNNLKTKRDRVWHRLAFLFADKIVFLSRQYQQEILKKFGNWYQQQKVEVIPNGVDLNLFSPLNAVSKQNETCVIGMQSRLINTKDHITLIAAIKTLIEKKTGINLLLQLAGEGDNKAALEKLTDQLALNNVVEFVGLLDEKELIRFLQRLDIYVHATLGETMSTAIMQAMACGKSIIASDVNGVNNMIIHNQNGLLVAVKNQTALADAIYLLAKNKALAKKLAQNAYQIAVEKYSNITMFEKYKKLFDQYLY